jgi:arylformamidase
LFQGPDVAWLDKFAGFGFKNYGKMPHFARASFGDSYNYSRNSRKQISFLSAGEPMTNTVPVNPDLENQYNVRLQREDFQQVMDEWVARSKSIRLNSNVLEDCEYGPGPADRLDVFRCGQNDAPLFVYLHGGYWQRGDKSAYSFVVEPFLASGADVALIGYQLCPDNTVGGIVEQVHRAMAWLYRNAFEVGICADRINVSGHSAGGHLTAMIMATTWSTVGSDLSNDLVKTGIPISGLFQLDPLRHTTINDIPGLDAEQAYRLSPQFLPAATRAPVLVTLGGTETEDFHWQADQYANHLRECDVTVDTWVEPGVDHFDVVNRLASADSEIFRKIRAWIEQSLQEPTRDRDFTS